MDIKGFIVLLCLMQGTAALDCFTCKDNESNNPCSKMGEEFDGDAIGLDPCNLNVTEGERIVCGKTLTFYQSVSDPENKGIIAQRYCDAISYDDQCWETYGAKTHTVTCVCSGNLCNTAAGLFTSRAAAGIVLILSFFFMV